MANNEEEPGSNPNCQSVVEGHVAKATGQRVAGATVVIEGAGWSRAMMTDDSGSFGFGGLCAGTATVQATLPGGQTGPGATVTLDGKNSVYVGLNAQGDSDSSLTPDPAAAQPTAPPTPTPDQSMPVTGYAGWLLGGGALLGLLLLLSAVARRLLRAQERA